MDQHLADGGIPDDSSSSDSSEDSDSDSDMSDDDLDGNPYANDDPNLQFINELLDTGPRVAEDAATETAKDAGNEPSDEDKINHFRLMKDNVTLQMLSTAAWCDISLQHRLTVEADIDIRKFQKITTPSGCLEPGGLDTRRELLKTMTGLRLKKHGRCPANCVAYADDDETTTHCPFPKCGKPRFKVTI